MGGLLMMARGVMRCSLLVVLGGVLMMFGSLGVMLVRGMMGRAGGGCFGH